MYWQIQLQIEFKTHIFKYLQIIEDESQYQNIIIQHMDIAEPLVTLRKLLEARLQCSLHDHEFWLQDSIQVCP